MRPHLLARTRAAAVALAAAILATATLAAPAAAQTRIAGNFGPGDSYQTGTANSWLTGVLQGSAPLVAAENAVSFQYTGAAPAELAYFRLVLNYFSGLPTINAAILEGADINTAVKLTDWILATGVPAGTALPPLQFIPSPGAVTFTPGNTYWIHLYHDDLGADPAVDGPVWGWQYNDQGDAGLRSRYLNLTAGTIGSWYQPSALNGDPVVTPVFDVYVLDPTSVVPEPATLALVAFGGGALALAARRRRAAA